MKHCAIVTCDLYYTHKYKAYIFNLSYYSQYKTRALVSLFLGFLAPKRRSPLKRIDFFLRAPKMQKPTWRRGTSVAVQLVELGVNQRRSWGDGSGCAGHSALRVGAEREKRLAFLETQGRRHVLRNRDLRVFLRPRNARPKESKEKIDAFGWASVFLAKN
jgi:hypothetical protein